MSHCAYHVYQISPRGPLLTGPRARSFWMPGVEGLSNA